MWNGDAGDAEVTQTGKAIVGNLIVAILDKHDPEAGQAVMGRTFPQALTYLSTRYGVEIKAEGKITDILIKVVLYSAQRSGLYGDVFSGNKEGNKNGKRTKKQK